MIQVQKKDGSIEDFDSEKIVSGLLNAGMIDEEAEDLAGEVENWIAENGKEQITSLEIKNKVLEFLKETNPEIVEVFNSYQKSTED